VNTVKHDNVSPIAPMTAEYNLKLRYLHYLFQGLLPGLLFFSSASIAQTRVPVSDPAKATVQVAGLGVDASLTGKRTTGIAHTQAEWVRQAKALERRRDWQGLLDWGRQWTQSEGGNAIAWFVQGRALNELKRNPEAIAAYQQSLRIEPGDVYARNNLGNVYRDSRRYRDAMHAYREAVRINPDYIKAWHNIGLTYYGVKGQAGVMDALKQAWSINPELATAWYRLMVDYSRSGDEATAQEAVRVLRRLKPDEVDRLFNILLNRL
jgi:tetratricopeptide (TPR) repeat protein